MIEIADIRRIYSKLGDDESRSIYESRLLYSLTGNDDALRPMIDEVRNRVISNQAFAKLYEKLMTMTDDVYIYGCGVYGKLLFELMPDVRWKGFIDASADGKRDMNGIPILLPETICGRQDVVVAVSSDAFRNAMMAKLKEIGIPESNIIDGTIVYGLTEGKQYFDLEEIDYHRIRSFIDGGSYDGMTALRLLDVADEVDKIWCFEADSRNLSKIEHKLKNAGSDVSCEIIDKGIWDKTTTISFVGNGSGESYIVESMDKPESTSEMIDVVSIDEVIGERHVDMIKFDIEGSELKGLEGASKLIKAQHPKLAICVYHKPEDIMDIPNYILGLSGDYRLYLRHYSFAPNETVLYAI